MSSHKQIKVIPITKLVPHPANPNRMAESIFKKLLAHIRSTGNYEPIVVRVHPDLPESYQIINGHHRVKALTALDVESADCVIWDVDDQQAMVLLATLNRISGNDDLQKKSELMKSLTKRFDIKQLVKMLPESTKSIQRLSSLSCVEKISGILPPLSLSPMIFFLDDQQTKTIEDAIAKASSDSDGNSGAKKKAIAITKISQAYFAKNI